MSSLRGIPTSRAYWELKAEQMMNRIFDPEQPIEIEAEAEQTPAAQSGRSASASRHGATPPRDPSHPRRSLRAAPGAPSAPAPREPLRTSTLEAQPARRWGKDQPVLLLSVLGGVCMVSAASSVLYLSHWSQVQQGLTQERNLLLVERLRNLGPANPAPALGPAPVAPNLTGVSATAPGAAADALPPPPEEPWMEQLSSLPRPEGSAAPVLRVPVSPRLAAAAPPATAPQPAAPALGPLPQLVGVVAAPGRAGSAIFQLGGSSTNVVAGETIGTSGWRLRSAEGESAVIERGGVVQRVAIGGG